METQGHEIERLKKSQQDFYVDLDKRLSQMQSASTASVAPKTKSATKSTVILEPKVESAVEVPTSKAIKSRGVSLKSAEEESAAGTTATTIAPTTEKDAYEAAYNFVRTKHYPEAISAFQDYLTRYSSSERAPNAYYWLGEVYMVQWQSDNTNHVLLDKASEAFLKVTSLFPSHQKVPDALLKLGILEKDKGNFDEARTYFTEVKDRFPSSAAARIAETRLQQLN